MSEDEKLIHHIACGPSNETCKCNCGVEGVERVCEHRWDGEGEEFDDGAGWTATCSRCGMSAFHHSLWTGP